MTSLTSSLYAVESVPYFLKKKKNILNALLKPAELLVPRSIGVLVDIRVVEVLDENQDV